MCDTPNAERRKLRKQLKNNMPVLYVRQENRWSIALNQHMCNTENGYVLQYFQEKGFDHLPLEPWEQRFHCLTTRNNYLTI